MRFARALAFALIAGVAFASAGVAEEEEPFKGPEGFKALKYRFVGPAIGGRVTRVAGVPGDPATYWFTAASGGVWKSTDGGGSWKPVFDDQPVASIGSLAVARSNPGVVYVGTGEANIRGNVKPGHGIFKTTDGGATWTHVWKGEGQIGTMVVHPQDENVAFAAVLGKAFGPSAERGVFRTKDGGKSWVKVLGVDADTGASDVALDPSNPNVVFAGFWQVRRQPWLMTSGGPGSSLWISRDGGDTWKKLEQKGLPEGIWGKVGVAVAPSDGRRVYALIEAEKGGLFRSDDGGENWSLVNPHRSLRQRAWYYTTLTIDPTNPDVVWFPQVPLLKTVDGGKTIVKPKQPHHADYHDAWIDPANPKRIIVGNDGGVDISLNGGESWFAPRLPIGQCYRVNVDDANPYRVSCALQDLGTASASNDSLRSGGITLADWKDVGGGEAGHTAHEPGNPDVVWAGEYMGIITRADRSTGLGRNVSIYPDDSSGHGAASGRYRFQWTAPIVISPHDPKTVYHAANVVLRTTDGGATWAPISPDLTRDDEAKQQPSGGTLTGDNTGVEWYGTVFALAESPRERGLLWAGTDDGRVHVTRDGGASWKEVTAAIPGLPAWATVNTIEPSPHEAATAYVVAHNYRLDDPRPYLWKTADYGKTWKSLTKDLDPAVHLYAVREDPERKGTLYVGTETGVVFSRDDGTTWQPLGLNLPTVPVTDLRVKDGDLVLGTHGRSIWILDDLTPFREFDAEVAKRPAHLFVPRDAVAWRQASGFHDKGPGQNPPRGAIVHYWLREAPKSEVVLEVLDAEGALVRRVTSTKEEPELPPGDPDGPWDPEEPVYLKSDPGIQRFVWDLRYDKPETLKKVKSDARADAGPAVMPGRYSLRLTVDGKVNQGAVAVTADPRLKLTPPEAEAQLAFARELSVGITRLTRTVEALRSVRAQIEVKRSALEGNAAATSWLESATSFLAACDLLESKLHNPEAEVNYDLLAKPTQLYSRLNWLYAMATWGDGAPTQGVREVWAELEPLLAAGEAEWSALVAGDLAALNAAARAAGIDGAVAPAGRR